MKKTNWISAATVAGLLVIGIIALRHPQAKPQPSPGSESLTTPARVLPENIAPVAAMAVVAATRPPAEVSPTAVTLVTGTGGDNAAMLRIKAGKVLATVNGVPIELKDLLPLPSGKETADQTLSAERYAFLLDRAVDRELTVQQARALGVELTEAQRQRLAGLRARRETPPANVFDPLQANPANAEFEALDAAALLLQVSLAERAGVPSRDVTTAQVEQYYQQHQAKYGALPPDAAGRQAAWEKIDQDIRVNLARQVVALHDESFQKYFDQLRASAQIVKTQPSS